MSEWSDFTFLRQPVHLVSLLSNTAKRQQNKHSHTQTHLQRLHDLREGRGWGGEREKEREREGNFIMMVRI